MTGASIERGQFATRLVVAEVFLEVFATYAHNLKTGFFCVGGVQIQHSEVLRGIHE
jgi:hypothetical protein